MEEFVNEILTKIGLNNNDFKNIDPYLLLLVFMSPSSYTQLDPLTEEYYKLTYGTFDYDRLEFLGDRVLDLVISERLFVNYEVNSSNALSKIKSFIVRNQTLSCLGKNLGLCNAKTQEKTCADIIEALIGALFYHLRITNIDNAYDYISTWIFDYFKIENILQILLDNKDIDTQGGTCFNIFKEQSAQLKSKYESDYNPDEILAYAKNPNNFERALGQISKDGLSPLVKEKPAKVVIAPIITKNLANPVSPKPKINQRPANSTSPQKYQPNKYNPRTNKYQDPRYDPRYDQSKGNSRYDY